MATEFNNQKINSKVVSFIMIGSAIAGILGITISDIFPGLKRLLPGGKPPTPPPISLKVQNPSGPIPSKSDPEEVNKSFRPSNADAGKIAEENILREIETQLPRIVDQLGQ